MAKVARKSGPPKSEEAHTERFTRLISGDARSIPLPDGSVDVIVTSPPYWQKRDYGVEGQIGQEATPDAYVAVMMNCMDEWRRLLTPRGSLFLNVGDTWSGRKLAHVPARLQIAADDHGWMLRNCIIWAKETGMPEPARTRLASRHEHIFHFVKSADYYYDIFGYSEAYGNGSNPGDLWRVGLKRNMGKHLAPFPTELVDRALALACPLEVCTACGEPRSRVVERTAELDVDRPQARRAMELAAEKGLTSAHIRAIQATGISDAGKALEVQTGTGKNTAEVRRLAAEAKAALGGYFREFTFAKKRTTGWTTCGCEAPYRPAVVLDPFMGTGTTLRVAEARGLSAVGVDLALLSDSKGSAKVVSVGTKRKATDRSLRRRAARGA
jgi:DNA modification methylase